MSQTIKLDITDASEDAIATLSVAIDTLEEECVRRDGSPTGMGRKIGNNGGSDRLEKRWSGEIDTPVTVNNARMWIRTIEECERREIPIPACDDLVTFLGELRDAVAATKAE